MQHPSTPLIVFDEPLVSRPEENATQRALRAALTRLDGGRNWWCGGVAATNTPVSNCIMQAVYHQHLPRRIEETAFKAIYRALGSRSFYAVTVWNDHPDRTFAEVEALYLKAITLAGEGA